MKSLHLTMTREEFRRLLDLVYLGNWVINAPREEQRIPDYDHIESLLFEKAMKEGMDKVASYHKGVYLPSMAFLEGGIHAPLLEYEEIIFYDVLAESLSLRDMHTDQISSENYQTFLQFCQDYYLEFAQYGVERLFLQEEESHL